MTLDISQPIMAAVSSSASHPQLSQRQIEIIAHDQQILKRRLVKIEHFSHASPAQVHERLGLSQQDSVGILDQLGDLRLKAILKPSATRARRQTVDRLETNIVPGSLIFATGIA